MKSVEQITVRDLEAFPVWELTNDCGMDTQVRPVTNLPIDHTGGVLIGTKVRFRSGTERWGLLGNLSATEPSVTEQFLTLSVENHGAWIMLARYFDADYLRSGPDRLAALLGLPVDEIFPIWYDAGPYVVGNRDALSGYIFKEPRRRLPRAELLAMAVG